MRLVQAVEPMLAEVERIKDAALANVLQKSIPAQIRQLILYYVLYKE